MGREFSAADDELPASHMIFVRHMTKDLKIKEDRLRQNKESEERSREVIQKREPEEAKGYG